MRSQEPVSVPWSGQSLASYAMAHDEAAAHAYYSEDRPASSAAAVKAKARRRRLRRALGAAVTLALLAAGSTGAWAHRNQQAIAAEYEDVWAQYEQVAAEHSAALVEANTIAEQCRVNTDDEATCDNLDRVILDAEAAFPSIARAGKATREAIAEARSAVSAGRDAIGQLADATSFLEETIREGVAANLRMALVKARAARAEVSDIVDFPKDEFAEEETLNSFIGLVARLDSHIEQAAGLLEGGAEIGQVEAPGANTDAEDAADEGEEDLAARGLARTEPIRQADTGREWVYEQAVAAEEGNPAAAALVDGASLAEAKDLTTALGDLVEDVREGQWPVRLAHNEFLREKDAAERAEATWLPSASASASAGTLGEAGTGQGYGYGQRQDGYDTGQSAHGQAGQGGYSQGGAAGGEGAGVPAEPGAPAAANEGAGEGGNAHGAEDTAANGEQPAGQ